VEKAKEMRLCSVPEYQQAAEGIMAPGLLIDIGQPNPMEIEMIEEEFGFTPTTSITFWRDEETDSVTVRTSLLQGCIALLEGNIMAKSSSCCVVTADSCSIRRRDSGSMKCLR